MNAEMDITKNQWRSTGGLWVPKEKKSYINVEVFSEDHTNFKTTTYSKFLGKLSL